MKIKFYLKNPHKKESLIVARILWGNYQLPYSTKQIVETAYWVKQNGKGERVQRVKKTNAYPIYTEINTVLDSLKSNINKVFNRYVSENDEQEPTPSVLNEHLDSFLKRGKMKPEVKKLPNFIEYFELFIEKSKKGVRTNRKTGRALSPYTIQTYNTLLGHLYEYNKNLEWQDINLAFHSDYTEFLMENKDLNNTSIGKDFSIIKVVCSEAYYEKINKYDDYKNPLFNVVRESSDSIHLNNNEINILYNLDLSISRQLEETKDLFILGCLTGLRYSDYSKILKSQIDEFKLHVKTVKGDRHLEVNVRDPKAQAIILKYKSNLPKGASNQMFNRHLKEICKNIPEFAAIVEKKYSKGGNRIVESFQKFELIKSHTARRSFCTNEVEAGTPIAIIMANSGHTTEKSFWKYVKLNKSHYFNMYDHILKDRYSLLAI